MNVSNVRLRSAVETHNASKRTQDIGEAWAHIFTLKLTDSDRKKLLEVKSAMELGTIGRDPNDMVTAKGAPKAFSKAEALRLYQRLQDRKRQETLTQMVNEMPSNYWTVQTEDQFESLLALLRKESEIVFDVETTGTNVYQDYIVGHVITAVEADVHAYIPIRHDTSEPQLDAEWVTKKLKPVYEWAKLKKTAHNAKFDIHMLANEGITLKGFEWDTMEAMRMLNENEDSYALKRLAVKYLKIPSMTYGDLFGKAGFNELADLRLATAYAAKDGDLTIRLKRFQEKHLALMPEVLDYYKRVEVPLINTLVHMERTGFVIDTEYAETYGAEVKAQIDALEAELNEQLDGININSPAQLKPKLEEVTGLTLESTDANKVLKPLAKEFPVIETLLKYKELNKLHSTYLSVLPELIEPKTGKLHANYNGNGAKTGRLSSGGNGVNLQNQPYEARPLFIAPKGYVIIGSDFSQQEYRCLAYFSQDPLLLKAYSEGLDIYAFMASQVYGKTYEECGDGTPERKSMKVVLLATVYGTSPATLAMQLKCSEAEAKKVLEDVFDRFKNVGEWIAFNTEFVRKHGFVYMDGMQRKRRLPDAKDKRLPFWKRKRAERQATNARVQGTASIQTKVTLNALHDFCLRKQAQGRDFRIWTCVHDEVEIQAPIDVTREEVAEFENIMLTAYTFGDVPNKCDVEMFTKWGEGMKVDEWFEK